NVSAPTITITPVSRPAKRGPLVGKVPRPAGTTRLPTIEPPIARIGMIIRKRPASMVSPSVTFHHGVLALSPANAEPLLPAALEYAYKTSDRPCAPALLSDETP